MGNQGFSLAQSDPVEAKCVTVRALLLDIESNRSHDLIVNCLGRENILTCHQLYGRHFQSHFPILHSPSHNFLEAPPELLLAMVMAGAYVSRRPPRLGLHA